ncbi:DUF305 domain-containing protein [Plantactinospora sp. B6F1]|uniref:DUF305 domain-containing protein n=1 Tax=Plantactinospora sp. B6F1 TaxID=3158971 RepID=UPI0010F0BBF5
MFSSRRRLLIAVPVAVIALGAGLFAVLRSTGDRPDEPAAAARVVQPGAPGQAGRTLSPAEQSQLPPPPSHTEADVRFMQRMIAHHAQALEMTALVADRAESPEVLLLAGRIQTSQRDETTQMQRWLAERGAEVPGPHSRHAGHDAAMPGMLTPEQMGRLRQARGREFDRLFLDFMIRHHNGALTMVQQLYAAGGGLEPAADRFAREVDADQTIEIRSLRELLTKLPD